MSNAAKLQQLMLLIVFLTSGKSLLSQSQPCADWCLQASVGTTGTQTQTISNASQPGTTDQVFGPTTVTGTGFLLEADGCKGHRLLPGQSCSITWGFQPTAAGTFNGTLTWDVTDIDEHSGSIVGHDLIPVRLTGIATGQQNCDLSPFKAASFTMNFSYSSSGHSSFTEGDGFGQVSTITSDSSASGVGIATLSYLTTSSTGIVSFVGFITGGTGSINSSSTVTPTDHVPAELSTVSANGDLTGMGGFSLDVNTSNCTARANVNYTLAGTFQTTIGSDTNSGPIDALADYTSQCQSFIALVLSGGQMSGAGSCQSGDAHSTLSWSTAPLTSESIQITSMQLSQGQPLLPVSPLTKVPLMANRPAVLQLKGKGTGPDPMPIKITIGPQTVNTSVPLSQLTAKTGASIVFTPSQSLGECSNVGQSAAEPYTLSISANGGSPVIGNVTVFRICHSIKYSFVAVNNQSNIVSDPAIMTVLTNKYLFATEPLDLSYTPSLEYDILDESNNLSAQVPVIGAISVITDLSIIAFKENADRAIGIITPKYMQTVAGKDVEGDSICFGRVCLPAVLIEDKFPESAAHELGHTYGLYTGTEDYNSDTQKCLTDVSASNFVRINEPSGSYLQTGPLQNYMCLGQTSETGTSDTFYEHRIPDMWATDVDFVRVGAQYTNASFDPETLIISGYIDQVGNVTLGKFYNNPSGYLSQGQSSGTYQLRVVSSSGSVLSSTYLPSGPAILQEAFTTLPEVPFVLSVNYPANASSIEVLNGPTVIVVHNIGYELLRTAVLDLQDGAFVATPTQHRTALVNMVNALDQQLTTGNTTGAYQLLTKDIQPRMSAWLSDSYVAPNPLFYTKGTLLDLAGELAQRLQHRN